MISLFYLKRPQIPNFLDYIDFVQPGLKEQACNLSAFLPYIGDNGLPRKRLVLETLPVNKLPELRDRTLGELLQFVNDMAEGGPSFEQIHIDEQLPSTQDTIESARNTHSYNTDGTLAWQEGEVGDPSNFPTDYGGYSRLPPPFRESFLPVIDQQFDMDVDWPVQEQSNHS
jgi:hypothetical protein